MLKEGDRVVYRNTQRTDDHRNGLVGTIVGWDDDMECWVVKWENANSSQYCFNRKLSLFDDSNDYIEDLV